MFYNINLTISFTYRLCKYTLILAHLAEVNDPVVTVVKLKLKFSIN